MREQFKIIKNYLIELNYNITHEDEEEGVLIIQDHDKGINNLILGIASPILIMEQYIFKI